MNRTQWMYKTLLRFLINIYKQNPLINLQIATKYIEFEMNEKHSSIFNLVKMNQFQSKSTENSLSTTAAQQWQK